jgi:signal transduction histidine kinase/DNA-binding response OmpR family regulator
MFVLALIISFYFFLVVREKEFLYFSIFLLASALVSLSSLHDVFLREYPRLLLYLYIIGNLFTTFFLIYFLRHFLKTFTHSPRWDKALVVFCFVLLAAILFSRFSSAVFRTNLSAASHFCFNASLLFSGIFILTTLYRHAGKRNKGVRLIIIALTPILSLEVLVYLLYVIKDMYSPRFGAPALHGQLSFSKEAFFIMILCYVWMMAFFTWVLFLRFSDIRKAFNQQSVLDQLKSRFFANISHEFRTPLTLILGPLDDFRKDDNREQLIGLVPAMHRNAERLLQLINQLLDLSRLDTHHYRIDTDREDIVPFVKQITHSFSSLAHRKNIELDTEIDPRLHGQPGEPSVQFFFDEDVLEKILTNLLSNAFKFTPSGGSVRVSVGLSDREKHMLQLSVADDGSGIDPEKLPLIFDRFYQADDSAVRRHEGSGIGLALVKELVELHGGRIEATSALGKGTVVYCYFPLNHFIHSGEDRPSHVPQEPVPIAVPAEEIPETGDDPAADGRPNPTVLVVEDQRDVRAYIRAKLATDYEVVEARDGIEGLDQVTRLIPDLMISDVMMPGMDGFDLCKKVKSDARTCHIPVILLTARAEDEDRMMGLETGADAYLVKPFNSRELEIRVARLIENRRSMREKFSRQLLVQPVTFTGHSRDQALIAELTEQVTLHIADEQFSVEDLAAVAHMSASQLNRKLKALVNQTSQQFIRALRMQKALALLKAEAGSIKEIAYMTGFDDPGYFTKVFKAHFGCLPSEREKFPKVDQPV